MINIYFLLFKLRLKYLLWSIIIKKGEEEYVRRMHVKNLLGNEKLARTIYTTSNNVLLSQGVQVKRSYINKLLEIGIEYIYVEDALSQGVEYNDIIEEKTREESKLIVKRVLETYLAQNILELEKLSNAVNNILDEILNNRDILVSITDIRRKDEYLYAHSVNVCVLSVLISFKMNFNKTRVKDIAIGALLHDFGKVLIPNDLLNKKTQYTKKDEEEIKKHVIYGFEAVKNEVWIKPISKVIILTHHERINGSGYPFGWRGEKIHDASKIITICNDFDNLTTNTSQKKPMKVYEALEYMISQSGELYDKETLKIFINNIAVYPSGVGVITNNNDKGIVLRQNKGFPSRPVIRILEENNKKIDVWKEIDLTESLTTFIVETIDI